MGVFWAWPFWDWPWGKATHHKNRNGLPEGRDEGNQRDWTYSPVEGTVHSDIKSSPWYHLVKVTVPARGPRLTHEPYGDTCRLSCRVAHILMHWYTLRWTNSCNSTHLQTINHQVKASIDKRQLGLVVSLGSFPSGERFSLSSCFHLLFDPPVTQWLHALRLFGSRIQGHSSS